MGRGDKKTKKGKIFMGSFGKSRPVTKKVKEAAAEKAKTKKEN
ncbi:MAG TPA: 30S ribosomal protein THX [Hanamia sp.]